MNKKKSEKKVLEVGTLLSYMYPNGLSHLYFQVIEIKGKFCIIRDIEEEVTKRTNRGWDYYTIPKANAFKDNSKPIRRMIRCISDEYVRVEKGMCAFIWNGKPDWNSHLD